MATERPTLARIAQLEAVNDSAGLLELLDPALPVMLRRAAARSLSKVASKADLTGLLQHLNEDNDRGVRQNLIEALGRLGDDAALPTLINALKDTDLAVQQAAAHALSRYNSPAAFETLLTILGQPSSSQDWSLRRAAIESLGRLGDRRAGPVLITSLRDPNDLVPPAAATALGQLGDPSAIPALKHARHATNHRVGAECALCEAIDHSLVQLQQNQKQP